MRKNSEKFGEGYFEKGIGSGYKNYSWRPNLIGPRLKAITREANVCPPSRILDFGCAKGFYVKYLRQLGFDAIGLDVSLYALSQAPYDVRKYLFLRSKRDITSFGNNEFSLTIAKDVLEHLDQDELKKTICELIRISQKLFVTVPICSSDGRYVNSEDEADVTHTIRYTREEWMGVLGAVTDCTDLCRELKDNKAKGTLCVMV